MTSSIWGTEREFKLNLPALNPTGPLHVGHGRVAVIRDCVGCACMRPLDFRSMREYYVNDAGNQMENLGLSIYVRYREICGEEFEFPEGGYPGDYVREIAAEIKQRHGDEFLREDKVEAIRFVANTCGDAMLEHDPRAIKGRS